MAMNTSTAPMANQTNNQEERGAALRAIDTSARAVVAAALVGELCVVLGNAFARAAFHHSFLWADEVARFALSILTFIGGAVAYGRREHATVSLVINLLPARATQAFLALADVLVLFAAAITGFVSYEFIASSWSERTPILQVPA